MISRTYIEGNLRAIHRNYLRARTARESLLLSKLAILELCGWIEESMDDIILRCAMRHLRDVDNRKFCLKQIVHRTYGFEYEAHFRSMLIRLIGLANVETLEAKVDPSKKAVLEAALSALKTQRDTEAHTFLRGTTRAINAPSATIAQFRPLYDGLMEFDRVIRMRRWS